MTHSAKVYRCAGCSHVFETYETNGEVRCPSCGRPCHVTLHDSWADEVPEPNEDEDRDE